MSDDNIYIHETAIVNDTASIGKNTKIWCFSQIREDVTIGENCIIGKNVYIDFGVTIGDNVKIQNNVSIYHGVTIKNGVFVGPHVCFTNDKFPRAINPDGSLKSEDDWELVETIVDEGAAIGANSTIVAGANIGKWAVISAGTTVTKNVPNHGLMLGEAGKISGWVCKCGSKLQYQDHFMDNVIMECVKCNKTYNFFGKDTQGLCIDNVIGC